MINSKFIEKYYDKRAACQVLGCLMKDPKKIKDRDLLLDKKDFSKELHRIIFICIYNLAYQNVNKITVSEIEGYLATANPVKHKQIFDNNETVNWIHKIYEDAKTTNYLHYYNKLKKMSLLKSYLENGINITDILDIDEIDPKIKQKQQERFDGMSIEDIMRQCDKKILQAKKGFIIKDSSDVRKAGQNSKELFDKMQEEPSYGLGWESEYLNTITRGMNKGHFYLETRDTGQGKTRVAIKRLLLLTAPYIWDFNQNNFIKNPNGLGNSALYIGTEMDIYKELEPMMWAFISGVDEEKIKECTLNKNEKERINEAISILEKTKLFLEHKPNFDTAYLWETVEKYKIEENIYGVGLDYIELNPGLINEFTSNTKGMGVREDQILLNLSINIKNIAEDLDVFMMAFTQTTDEARRDGIRDQRAVKGARSLPNKTDGGVVVFEPTKKELEKISGISQKKGLVEYKNPNICYSFYKNRGNKYKNIKIWGYQDLGTMKYCDLFCTDNNYKPININPTKIEVINEKIKIN